MNSKFKILNKGFIEILPLLIPVIPFGIIFGAIVVILVGYFSKNVIAIISSGLISYWLFIFVI